MWTHVHGFLIAIFSVCVSTPFPQSEPEKTADCPAKEQRGDGSNDHPGDLLGPNQPESGRAEAHTLRSHRSSLGLNGAAQPPRATAVGWFMDTPGS